MPNYAFELVDADTPHPVLLDRTPSPARLDSKQEYPPKVHAISELLLWFRIYERRAQMPEAQIKQLDREKKSMESTFVRAGLKSLSRLRSSGGWQCENTFRD
jgi:hypothetical protein